ncbi:hypothetical protein U746_2414 [Mycolicibacterium mucogenicum 261Sha1.1M5]|nr:hypothetical protein U746_2414 [Mycolicibacterium mucogenicum 261Sha1.1M5]
MVMPAVMIGSAAVCLWCAARTRSPLRLVAACVMLGAMLDHGVTGYLSPMLWAAVLVGVGVLVGASLRPSGCDDRAAGAGGAAGAAAAPMTAGAPVHAQGILTALSYPAMGALLLVSAAPPPQANASLTVVKLHDHGTMPSLEWLAAAVGLLAVGLACTALAATRGGRSFAAADAGAMSLMLGAMLL